MNGDSLAMQSSVIMRCRALHHSFGIEPRSKNPEETCGTYCPIVSKALANTTISQQDPHQFFHLALQMRYKDQQNPQRGCLSCEIC